MLDKLVVIPLRFLGMEFVKRILADERKYKFTARFKMSHDHSLY